MAGLGREAQKTDSCHPCDGRECERGVREEEDDKFEAGPILEERNIFLPILNYLEKAGEIRENLLEIGRFGKVKGTLKGTETRDEELRSKRNEVKLQKEHNEREMFL